MADTDVMVSQNYTNSENMVVGPYGETFSVYHDDQAVNIKDEEVLDSEKGKDPVPLTVQEIKAESEVSNMFLYVSC
jgi:hypothetical protein